MIFVVPCYNEGKRLDDDAFLALAKDDVKLLFVDDGSKDDTAQRLAALKERAPDRVDFFSLEKNSGKAEAVRRGMKEALARGNDVIGYVDADLSTPVPELQRLWTILRDRSDVKVLLAARVSLLGNDIRRKAMRHYLGRVFASIASLMLHLRVYDTQCGAKLFRRTPALESSLDDPFMSRWAFDVELIGRLVAAGTEAREFLEVPLRTWRDVPGSKLRFGSMAKTLVELGLIGKDLARRRRQP